MPLLSSFIAVLVVSVVWDISGLCSNKSVSAFLLSMFLSGIFLFVFFFFVCRHSQRPNRQHSELPVRAVQTAVPSSVCHVGFSFAPSAFKHQNITFSGKYIYCSLNITL